MKNLLLFFLALPLFFTSCKDKDDPCEEFKNEPARIITYELGADNKTQIEVDTIWSIYTYFKTSKTYDSIVWVVQNDPNYTYRTPTFQLKFPVGTFKVRAIGYKSFNTNNCGTLVVKDTMNKSFTTARRFHDTHAGKGTYEVESEEFPGKKWKFNFYGSEKAYDRYGNPAITDGTDEKPFTLINNFPEGTNDSIEISMSPSTGSTYFSGFIPRFYLFKNKPFKEAEFNSFSFELDRNTKTIKGSYSVDIRRKDDTTRYDIVRFNFKGKKI
jgi:hypothetical protein